MRDNKSIAKLTKSWETLPYLHVALLQRMSWVPGCQKTAAGTSVGWNSGNSNVQIRLLGWDSLSAKWIEWKANKKILHLVDGMYLVVLNQLNWVVDATATDAAFEIVIELVSGMSILIQQCSVLMICSVTLIVSTLTLRLSQRLQLYIPLNLTRVSQLIFGAE